MSPPRRIYLAGFMGCGKTTVAPHLARLLGMPWIDLDAEIERRTGRSIAELFAGEGERRFREIEREVLVAAAGEPEAVVALGGGTIANEENFALVKSSGVLVWLRVDFESLYDRLEGKKDRPLLLRRPGGGGRGELRETMRRLLAEREPFYRRADLTVTPASGDPAATAGEIAEALGRRAGAGRPTG